MSVHQQSITVESSWQQQLRQAINSPQQLADYLQLPNDWVAAHQAARQLFPLRVPKHFANLMQLGNINDPLLRQVMPLADEFNEVPGYHSDPLGEEQATAIPGLLHKYHSRVLLIVRGGCAINCRYCFRRHFPYQQHQFGAATRQRIISYLQQHPEVNEVILSGGDPLMAPDKQLIDLIHELEHIPHLTRLRIHSRLPVVIPARLTEQLKHALQQSRFNVVLVIHSNHPNEISPELVSGLQTWRQANIWLLNQSVLLKGVNDNAEVLAELSERLFAAGVMPYYLHKLDKVAGAAHFQVSDANANLIISELLRCLPGFLVPSFVEEIAGEVSKTPIITQP